ncbi:MAG: SMP-30/gluconolactonase/LRE family protein [Chitinophagales bacterium]|nr:SMP-30/gluconolactonase/LRE family protein [Hyphomicrobiales bacterium]
MVKLFAAFLALAVSTNAHAAEASLKLSGLAYPEGVFLHESTLYFTEMDADRIMASSGGGAFEQVWTKRGCGPTSISALGGARFLITCHLAGGLAIWDKAANTTEMVSSSRSGRIIAQPNDSIGDGGGGAFFGDSGTFAPGADPEGRVYHYGSAGVTEIATGIAYANGVTYEPGSRTLYVSAHLGRQILKITDPLSPTQQVSVFWDYREKPCSEAGSDRWLFGPDGLELRPESGLFVAMYGGDAVYELDASGACAAVHSVGAALVTSTALDAARNVLWIVGSGVIKEKSVKGGLFELPLSAR